MSRPHLYVIVVDFYGEATVQLKADMARTLPGHLTFRTREHAQSIADKVNAERGEGTK